MIGRTSLASLLAVAIVVGACGSASPTPAAPSSDPVPSTANPSHAPGPSASASQDVFAGGLADRVLTALNDPSAQRQASTEREFLAHLDDLTGLTAAIGPELEAWRREQRSAAITKALEAAGIDTASIGPTALSSRPVAAVDGGLTALGEAWIGSMFGGSLLVNAGMGQIGPAANGQVPLPGHTEATDTQTVGDQRMTATFKIDMTLSVTGSLVIADADATESDSSVSVSTGNAIGTSNHRSHIHVEVKVCPDANGVAEVRTTVDLTTDARGMPGGGAANVTATTTEEGHVNDAAYLASRDSTIDAQFDRTFPDGSVQSGSATTTSSFTYGSNGTATNLAPGSTGSITGSFDVGEASGFLSFVMMTTMMVTMTTLEQAQAQWRGGKCVVVVSNEQSRTVGPNDVVHFNAHPRQVIEGVDLNKPIVASFSGEKSVTPVDVEVNSPADFTFTASAREVTGRTTLKSTSNRGIGTLDLAFAVKFQGWFIDQAFTNAAGATGKVEGKRCGDDPETTWEAKGTYEFLGFKGKQAWTITINDKGFVGNDLVWTGRYDYRDDSTDPLGVKGHARVSGTVSMIISEADGSATMKFKEQSRRQWAEAPGGGYGSGPDSPQPMTDMVWTSDANC